MILLTFLSLLSFSIYTNGKPLPASGRQESHALYAREDPLPVPNNPDAGSPMCPINSLSNILDGAKCNSGDDILISGPPQKYPDPPAVDPAEIKDFTGLAGAINAASAQKGNLPICKRDSRLPDSNACRDQEPDQWVLELDPDPDSKLGLTVEMSAGDACPYTRLPDYKYLSGPKQGKVENATLIDIYHDVNDVDNEVWRQAAEQELDEILNRNDEVFQKYWGMSVYDYAMINGTSLDPRKTTKRASVDGSIEQAEAENGGGPPPEADQDIVAPPITDNFAVAVHKKGDLRLFLFGYLPIFMAVVTFTKLSATPSDPKQRFITWGAAFQQSGGVIIALTGALLAHNLRERWRTRLMQWYRFKRATIVFLIKLLAYFGSCTANAQYWLARHYPESLAAVTDTTMVERLSSFEQITSTSMRSSGDVVLDIMPPSPRNTFGIFQPQGPPPRMQAPMTIRSLDEISNQMHAWHERFQAECQVQRNALVAADDDVGPSNLQGTVATS